MSQHRAAQATPRPAHPLISVVVPVFNEEACLEEVVRRLVAVFSGLPADLEMLFVDDGSDDGTLAVVEQLAAADDRIKFLSLSRNFGHQVALAAGLENAAGDVVISMDGDLQHPPELIPTLIDRWRQGDDVVYTIRKANRGHGLKEALSRSFYVLLRRLTGVDVPTGGADFRLLDRKVVNALGDCNEHFVFVRGLVPWLGFKRSAVDYEASQRFAGRTKYMPRRMLAFALDGVFAFSTVPLRFISIMGAVTIVLGLAYGSYSVYVRLFTDRAVSGWTSLVVVMLVFSGTQLLSLGILSEYIGRIYEEVKRRPRYVVDRASAGLPAAASRSLPARP